MTGPTRTRLRGAAFVLDLALAAPATPASAQFGWFGQSEASPQDVYATVGEHGFRLAGPLYRTGQVYVADVIDRRGRRERLVVSAANGQIVQRFFVDLGPSERRQAMAERPRPRDDDSFFDRLSRGWGDEPAPRPPLAIPQGARPDTDPGTVLVPRAKARPEPRVVTRTDLPSVKPPAPTAVPGPATPSDAKPDASASPATPASPPRATAVTTDPLRIPGTRKATEPKPPAATVATVKPPEATPASAAPAQPVLPRKPAQPADVPVAPLD